MRISLQKLARVALAFSMVAGSAVAMADSAAAEVVFCKKKNKVKTRWNSCKSNESQQTGPVAQDGQDGEKGDPGDPGPQGASGVVAYGDRSGGASSGTIPNPTATTDFLVLPVEVDVVSGENVLVTSHRAFGSTVNASGLDLAICYRSAGSAAEPAVEGATIHNLNVDATQRVPMGLSRVISGLSTGSYEFGLCGDDDGNGGWNYNEDGSTTVLVFRAP